MPVIPSQSSIHQVNTMQSDTVKWLECTSCALRFRITMSHCASLLALIGPHTGIQGHPQSLRIKTGPELHHSPPPFRRDSHSKSAGVTLLSMRASRLSDSTRRVSQRPIHSIQHMPTEKQKQKQKNTSQLIFCHVHNKCITRHKILLNCTSNPKVKDMVVAGHTVGPKRQLQ